MAIACYSSILWPKYLLQNITTAARDGHPQKTPGGSDMSCRKSHKPREEKAIKWQEKYGSNGFLNRKIMEKHRTHWWIFHCRAWLPDGAPKIILISHHGTTVSFLSVQWWISSGKIVVPHHHSGLFRCWHSHLNCVYFLQFDYSSTPLGPLAFLAHVP